MIKVGAELEERATIVVENVRSWVGNQKRGAVHVSLDGHNEGTALPNDRLVLSCAPGLHRVRVRQWWYRSAPLNVEVQPREELELVADRPKGNLLTCTAVLMFRPWRSISLERRVSAGP